MLRVVLGKKSRQREVDGRYVFALGELAEERGEAGGEASHQEVASSRDPPRFGRSLHSPLETLSPSKGDSTCA
ncbi:MAG: hypothetical protein Rubg2KO_02280 [Rubricoccaceae bacterium]